MMAARVRTAGAFAVLAQKRLFSTVGFLGRAGQATSYDVTADGQHFVMLRQYASIGADGYAPDAASAVEVARTAVGMA